MDILIILAANFGIALACVVALWLICILTRDPTPMDSFWAFGLMLMAWTITLTAIANSNLDWLTGFMVNQR